MNLKALFLALALSIPFAAASATVAGVASADPLPAAAQLAKPAPGARPRGETKRGEVKRGSHKKGERRAEHKKGERKNGAHRRGGHKRGERGQGQRGNGAGRPGREPGKR